MFDSKDPAEEITLTFDYSARGQQVSSASITVRLVRGIDPNPSAILSGTPQYEGAYVLQKVKGGIRGCHYNIICVATVGNDKLLVESILPVNSYCSD
jgi:hypothetical protein